MDQQFSATVKHCNSKTSKFSKCPPLTVALTHALNTDQSPDQ